MAETVSSGGRDCDRNLSAGTGTDDCEKGI